MILEVVEWRGCAAPPWVVQRPPPVMDVSAARGQPGEQCGLGRSQMALVAFPALAKKSADAKTPGNLMRRLAAITLLTLGTVTVANAQSQLTPQSFVTQVKANGPRVAAWAKVYAQESQYRQVTFQANVRDIDVVASQSLLRPYLGKALISYSIQHGPLFGTAEEAQAAQRPQVLPESPFGECEVMFLPREDQWRFEEARCRNSTTKQWMLMDRDGLVGKPLGDMLAELDTPVAKQPPAPKRR